jgi:hypothetical protein
MITKIFYIFVKLFITNVFVNLYKARVNLYQENFFLIKLYYENE